MKSGFSILASLLVISSVYAQQPEQLLFDADRLLVSRKYVCFKATQDLNIDGRDDDSDWQDVKFTQPFIDIEGEQEPELLTRVKMLWDDNYFYIYAEMEEPHIWAKLTEHDAIIYHDNDFEVFIDPDNDGRNYSEIEINALNTTWDLMLDKPYRLGGIANDYFEMEEMQHAVYVDGTINDPSDIDRYWSVELAIPMESILLAKHRGKKFPRDKDIWRVNFSRVEWDFEISGNNYKRKMSKGKLLPEKNWVWAPQFEINMHIPELWGYVQFSDERADSEIKYQATAEELSRQVSYELFRRFKFGDMVHFADRKSNMNYTKHLPPFSVDDQDFAATYYKTPHGFEVIVHNITQNRKYMIDESGYLRELGNY